MSRNITSGSLNVFEALASETRLAIIKLLANKSMNIAEIAGAMGLSSAAVTVNIRKLEDAGIVTSETVPGKHGAQKLCSLAVDSITVPLRENRPEQECYTALMPVGAYVAWKVNPTCGLAEPNGFIGQIDDPRFFADPARTRACMLWLGSGYVEYRFPNYLLPSQQAAAVEFTAELSSEVRGFDDDYPSDIFLSINGVEAGMWTSPGDFGGRRGAYTPAFIPDGINQYGLLKVFRIDDNGTTVDGVKISDVTIGDINLANRNDIILRLTSPEDAVHPGGLTIFGSGFGNYGRDPELRLYYRPRAQWK